MRTITRLEAKSQGLKAYYVAPCKHGHDSGRYVKSGACRRCTTEASKLTLSNLSPEERNRRNRMYCDRYREKSSEEYKKYQREYHRVYARRLREE